LSEGQTQIQTQIQDQIHEFLSYIRVELALSENTHLAYAQDLNQYIEFCQRRKLDALNISLKELRQFLANLRQLNLGTRSIARKLSTVKQFYKFLLREDKIHEDPAELLNVTVKAQKLPEILSVEEMAELIEAAQGKNEMETRDRALLELWYATGCRISEIAALNIYDIDWKGKTAKFQGKGGHERLVPVHDHAISWCKKYRDIRHRWLQEKNLRETDRFFLTQQGKGFTRQGIWKSVKKYAKKAGLAKNIWPHMIRHSFATHILQSGADLRSVQELLGHRSISATEIYTHLDNENLKVMQIKFHPRR